MPRKRIIGLVAVHVDPQAALGSQFAQQAHRFGPFGHGALEMRDAADHIHPEIQRPRHLLPGVGIAQVAVLGKGAKLEIDVGRNNFV